MFMVRNIEIPYHQGAVGFVMAHYAPQLTSYNILFMISASALILSILCIVFTSTKQQTLNTAQINS